MLVGFLAGVGVQVAIGQLPDMLGLTVHGSEAVPVLVHTLGAVAAAHGADVAVSAGVIVMVLGTRALTRRFPGALIAVVLAIAASRLFDLASHGVAVVGTVPRGLPSLALPALDGADATQAARHRGGPVRGHPGAEHGDLARLRREVRRAAQRPR